MKLDEISEEDARRAVVRWYLGSFGPVSENDVAWWTGFRKSEVRRILSELEDEVMSVDVSGCDKSLLVLSRDEAELKRVKSDGEPVVNLLPSLDPFLMGYKDRDRYLDAERYNFVFDRGGNATSSILVDGKIIGVWDFEERAVKVFLFEKGKASFLEEVSGKARSLGVFISGHDVDVKVCGSMVPLNLLPLGA